MNQKVLLKKSIYDCERAQVLIRPSILCQIEALWFIIIAIYFSGLFLTAVTDNGFYKLQSTHQFIWDKQNNFNILHFFGTYANFIIKAMNLGSVCIHHSHQNFSLPQWEHSKTISTAKMTNYSVKQHLK